MGDAFKLGLAQVGYEEGDNPYSKASYFVDAAAGMGVQLLVFPEGFMTPWQKTLDDFKSVAEPLEGPFGRHMAKLAEDAGMTIVYTAIEQNGAGEAPYNTAAVIAPSGNIIGSYRKTHLFDTGFVQESDHIAAGDMLARPIADEHAQIGLAICYDLRFPEIARKLALQGAQLLLYPAAWYDGDMKRDHWEVLLRSRAIENEVFVAGCTRCDGKYLGYSCVIDPFGRIITQAGPYEELLCADIDLSLAGQAREAIPVLTHRRPELYL